MTEQAELLPEAEQAPPAPKPVPPPSPDDLTFRLGQRPLRMVPYARNCWRSVDPEGVTLRRPGERTWLASFGVGLEGLGPYKDEMALCMARGIGSTKAEAEESLNAELEGIRVRIGAPEVTGA